MKIDTQAVRRTLSRTGPNCDDFKDGLIRDLKTWCEKLLEENERLRSQWQIEKIAPKNHEFLGYRKSGDAYWILIWNEVKMDFLVPGTNFAPIFDVWCELPKPPEVEA